MCGVRHCSRPQSVAFPKLRNAGSHRLLLCSPVLCEVMDSFLGEASISDIELGRERGGKAGRGNSRLAGDASNLWGVLYLK